jgi:hypothetical protein
MVFCELRFSQIYGIFGSDLGKFCNFRKHVTFSSAFRLQYSIQSIFLKPYCVHILQETLLCASFSFLLLSVFCKRFICFCGLDIGVYIMLIHFFNNLFGFLFKYFSFFFLNFSIVYGQSKI